MQPLDGPNRGGRWIALAVCFLSIAASLAVVAQTGRLRLVSTAWPPFTNEPGQPRFALDLVEAALGRVGLSTTTTIVEAERFTPALLEGEFDGSAAAWKDADRDRVLLFSQPYLENRLVLVGRKGSDVSAPALDALKGKRIAIVGGYSVRERHRRDGVDLRALAQRGGQSRSAARQPGRLRSDGRARRRSIS